MRPYRPKSTCLARKNIGTSAIFMFACINLFGSILSLIHKTHNALIRLEQKQSACLVPLLDNNIQCTVWRKNNCMIKH